MNEGLLRLQNTDVDCLYPQRFFLPAVVAKALYARNVFINNFVRFINTQ